MTEDTTPPTSKKKRAHAARSARILSTGLSATAILGMTAAYGAAEKRAASVDDPVVSGSTAVAPLTTPALPTAAQDHGQAPGLAPLAAGTPSPTVAGTPAPQVPAAVGAAGKVASNTGAPASSAAPQTAPLSADNTVAPTPQETVAPVATAAPVVPVETAAPVAPVQTAAPVETIPPVATAAPPVQLTVPAAPPQGRTSGSN